MRHNERRIFNKMVILLIKYSLVIYSAENRHNKHKLFKLSDFLQEVRHNVVNIMN